MRENLSSSSSYKNVSHVLSFTYIANECQIARMVVEPAKFYPKNS